MGAAQIGGGMQFAQTDAEEDQQEQNLSQLAVVLAAMNDSQLDTVD